jgi:hypothetical protein
MAASSSGGEVGRVFRSAWGTLVREGVLLKSDPKLPSVVAIAAGGPVRGSWWGHPKGRVIFNALERLAELNSRYGAQATLPWPIRPGRV